MNSFYPYPIEKKKQVSNIGFVEIPQRVVISRAQSALRRIAEKRERERIAYLEAFLNPKPHWLSRLFGAKAITSLEEAEKAVCDDDFAYIHYHHLQRDYVSKNQHALNQLINAAKSINPDQNVIVSVEVANLL